MKIRNTILLTACCLLVCMICTAPVAAYQNYDTEAVYGEAYAQLLRQVSDFALTDEPERDRMIKCFAISEEGKIALAFDGEYAQIDVYQSDGTWLYGYSFENRNSAFSVFFEGETLCVYHAKSGFVASFDARGNCVLIHKAVYTQRTSDAYRNDFYRPSSGQIGGLSYTAEKSISLTKYARFTVEDQQGNKTVIYEVSREAEMETILMVVVGAAIVIGGWFCVRRYNIEREAEDKA